MSGLLFVNLADAKISYYLSYDHRAIGVCFMKVAAIQFATTCDVKENLQTCLRMIDRAASVDARLMVLPEFCNHLSWYDDLNHAWEVAVEKGDEFYQAIAAKARQHQCHIVINISYRRHKPAITVTSLLFGPDGQCLVEADKQTLMGHENIFFTRAKNITPVVDTQVGRLGLFPCRDGVTCETPRSLALRGAQIFCDSLNSFAFDEAALHVPARAVENKVFLIAANKVGPLIPAEALAGVSEQTAIPEKLLFGAGESQIVSPSGEILARAPRHGEAVVVADINLDEVQPYRVDGTHWFHSRRPELYQPIAEPPAALSMEPVVAEASVSLLQPKGIGETALQDSLALLQRLPAGTAIAVLPELFWLKQLQDLEQAAATSRWLEESLLSTLQQRDDELVVCLSLVDPANTGDVEQDRWCHVGVVLNKHGRLLVQPQLHAVQRLSWSQLGDRLQTLDLPIGRAAVLVGDDAAYPELVKVAALQGVHMVLLPYRGQEAWETQLGLPSRAAENRICILASAPAGNPCGGLIATLERDFTLMTSWRERTFDGYINTPLITGQRPGITLADIHPQAAVNKVMSENTDLLQQRPWRLSGTLVEAVSTFPFTQPDSDCRYESV